MDFEAWVPRRPVVGTFPAEPSLTPGPDPREPFEHVWRDSGGVAWATCRQDGARRTLGLHGFGVFELDLETGRISGEHTGGLPAAVAERRFWNEAVPILHQANGATCLHASAVELPEGAVVLVGPSTAGKSTLARAWSLSRGARQLADDTVVIYPTGPGAFEVHPLPFAARVRGRMRAHLDEPDLEVTGCGAPVRVAALVFVEAREAGSPRLDPIAAGAWVTMLAESCCFSIADRTARTGFYFAHLDLLAAVPGRRLVYPHTVTALDATIALLESFRRSSPQIPASR